jgi:hypothetical protein
MRVDNLDKPHRITIFDCELIGNTAYAWDYAVADGIPAPNKFEDRVANMRSLCEKYSSPVVNIIAKIFTKITDVNLESAVVSTWKRSESNPLLPCDGMIFTPGDASYHATLSRKWKPLSHMTIDFLAVLVAPDSPLLTGDPDTNPYITPLSVPSVNTQPGKYTYILFVGIQHMERLRFGIGLIEGYDDMMADVKTDGRYYPVQFSTSFNPLAHIFITDIPDLHMKIVELSLMNAKNPQWEFHKIRDDRTVTQGYYGNNYRFAEEIYSNYIDPLPLEGLYNVTKSYFVASKTSLHRASNKFRRFVANASIKSAKGVEFAIDLACGRGADLQTWRDVKAQNVLMIDRDSSAIAELIERKFSTHGGSGSSDTKIIRDNDNLCIWTMVSDMLAPDLLQRSTDYIGANTVDAIVCNFAIHYICDTIDHMKAVMNYVKTMLRVGGEFSFVTMDGKSVYDLLSKGEYTHYEGSVLKYGIKPHYKGKLLPCGQYISVWLDLANAYVDEPLCVVEELIKCGGDAFECVSNDKFSKYWDDFEKETLNFASKVTDDDKNYSDLFRRVVLRKVSVTDFSSD